MSEKKRRIMSGAQKAKVALAAVKGNKTVNEIAKSSACIRRKSAFGSRRYWKMLASCLT